MSVLNRKLARDLRSTRGTLASILLVILVGIATFVGMLSVYLNLEQSRRDYYAQSRMADFWISLKKAPLPEIERVAATPGIAEIRTRISFRTTIDLENAIKPINGLVLSMPEARGPVINNIVLTSGRWFGNSQPNEVIVNAAFARARHIRPGQVVHVILNNRRQALEVIGTAMSAEFVYLMAPGSVFPDPENYGVLYVKERFAEEVLDFDGAANEIVGRLTPEARANPAIVLDQLELLLEPYGVLAATPRAEQPSHRILSDELAQLRTSSVVLPMIFLGVAVLILNILTFRMAEQQRTTIGTLKALGYSDAQLMRHFMAFGLLVGLLGGLLGSLAGHAMAQGMTVMYRPFFELPRLENRFVPWVHVVALVIAVASAVLGTVRGVRAVIDLQPAEAMRAKPPSVVGAMWLERYRRLWKALGFRWQMALRAVWRHKLRTASGLFAAAMGAAMLFTTFYFLDSIRFMIDYQFDKVLVSDFDLSFREDLDDGALLEAQRLPGVDRAEALFQVPCEIAHGHRSKRTGIIGIAPGARMTAPHTREGERVPPPDSGLLMSRFLADWLGVGRGDTVVVRPIRGRRDPRPVIVHRVIDDFVGFATYADQRWLNALVDEEHAVSSVQLEVRPDLDSRLALYAAIKGLPAVQAISDNGQAKDKLVTTLLDTLRYSISALIGMAAVIFFGGILTTSLISISERQREIATFLVLGLEPRQVGGVFLRESLLVNVTGALIGLPLGLLLVVWLIRTTSQEAFRLPLVTSPLSYVVTIGLAVSFTLAAHLLVQGVINRLDWREALNAKE